MDHHLVQLDPDHPGFRDPAYRARRDSIARIASAYRSGDPVPTVAYTPEEHDVWSTVLAELAPLHREHVAHALLTVSEALRLPAARIPQLHELNARLAPAGFRMEPVAGLVQASIFLQHLGRSVFLSTQYVRHPSRPFYTPEPDVLHEVVGHAASLLHPGIGRVSRLFGACAEGASPAEIERLTRVYWYTLEFGLVEEEGTLKAYGAGLLSSVGELRRSVEDSDVERVPFDPDRTAARPYDPTAFQPVYDVGPGLGPTLERLEAWLRAGGWRD